MSVFSRPVATFILGALGGSSVVYLLGNPMGSTSASSSAAYEEPPSSGLVQPVPPALPTQTGPVADAVLEVTGKTRPAPGRQSLIAPTVLHPVVKVAVKPGDRVKAGQVLVKLDGDEPKAAFAEESLLWPVPQWSRGSRTSRLPWPCWHRDRPSWSTTRSRLR